MQARLSGVIRWPLIHFNGLGVRQLDPEQPNVRKWRFIHAARRHANSQPQRNARCYSVERDSLYA